MSLEVTSTPTTGYEDIDRLNKSQDELSNKMYETQEGIVNTQVEQNVNDIERNKEKLQEETTKTNKASYADYLKQVNPYGNNAESLLSNGLGNSGVAESSKVSLYNSYQKNRTDTLNTARNLLADYNNQISQAKKNGDIQLAQYAQNIYNQKMNSLYQNYQLMQNAKNLDYQRERDQVADRKWQSEFDYNKAVNDRNYNYQVGRDQVADSQWQSEFDYNKAVNDRNYNYQVGRDTVADSQWEKEYALSKAKSSNSGSSKKSVSSGNTLNLNSTGSGVINQSSGANQDSSQSNVLVNAALAGLNIANAPTESLASSLAERVKNGEITEEEAYSIINKINWK